MIHQLIVCFKSRDLPQLRIGCCDRLCGWGSGCRSRYPPKFRNMNEILVERAADPTNILWEHLQYSTNDRIKREICTTIAVFGLIALGSYLTALIKSPEASSPGHIHKNIFLEIGLPSFLATIPLSVLTVIINTIIKKIYESMATWETHHHISGQEEWLMVKIAVGQFLNMIFVQWYMYGFPWSEPGWYEHCVPNIMSYMVITIVMSTVVSGFLGSRKAKQHDKLLAQQHHSDQQVRQSAEEKSKKALSGFRLAEQYAQVLGMVFVTLFYASPVPIVVPFLAICKWKQNTKFITTSTTKPLFCIIVPYTYSCSLQIILAE